mgnify:CR=1 FL=1
MKTCRSCCGTPRSEAIACNGSSTRPDWIVSAGGEINLDAALPYDVPYRFRLGVAAPVRLAGVDVGTVDEVKFISAAERDSIDERFSGAESMLGSGIREYPLLLVFAVVTNMTPDRSTGMATVLASRGRTGRGPSVGRRAAGGLAGASAREGRPARGPAVWSGPCEKDRTRGAAAEWALMIRNLFVREEGERLVIGAVLERHGQANEREIGNDALDKVGEYCGIGVKETIEGL